MSFSQELILGKAGEFRIISELLLRGYKPAQVCCDNGVDVVLENGNRIQIKTSATPQKTDINGHGYKLKTTTEYYAFGLKHGKHGTKCEYDFDFIIFWIIPLNRFYIVPKKEVETIRTVIINKNDMISRDRFGKKYYESRFLKYKDNWDLLKKEVKNVI